MEADARQTELDVELDELFDCWDSEASGLIDVRFIECTLSLYQPVPLADAVASGIITAVYSTQYYTVFQ